MVSGIRVRRQKDVKLFALREKRIIVFIARINAFDEETEQAVLLIPDLVAALTALSSLLIVSKSANSVLLLLHFPLWSLFLVPGIPLLMTRFNRLNQLAKLQSKSN